MFTDQEEISLIKLVAQNPALYDPRNKDYRSQAVRDQLWREFAVRLNKTAEECKKKWKCIRDSKNRYKKDCKSKHKPLKHSKDERHKLLSFITRTRKRAPRSTNEDDDNTMSSNPLSPLSDDFKYFDSENIDDVSVRPEFVVDDSIEYEEAEIEGYKAPNSRHSQETNENDLLKRLSERDETCRMVKSFLSKKEDDIDLFCRYIAQVLKSLPPMHRAEAKKQLGEIVCNYEIKAATETLEVSPI